jgi:Uma2 family endonuclease
MSQTLLPPPKVPPELVTGQVLLRNISWDTYTALLQDIGDGAARLTYDNGLLEIELPSRLHEQIRAYVAEMVSLAMRRLSIQYEPAGATTWKKYEHLRGLEADECYHIQNVQRELGESELDLTREPPPDLAVEVVVTAPVIEKIEIYRTLKVPELWRVNADATCQMLLLDDRNFYQTIDRSVAIPLFTPQIMSHYLLLREQAGHSAGIDRFDTEVVSAQPKP